MCWETAGRVNLNRRDSSAAAMFAFANELHDLEPGLVARSLNYLAQTDNLARPAVSQHIGVLREAGLLHERRVGAKRLYVVRQEGFVELVGFIEGFWRPRLQRLKQAAEAAERSKNDEMNDTSDSEEVALRSTSMRHPKRCSRS